jgi:hypothetical protein
MPTNRWSPLTKVERLPSNLASNAVSKTPIAEETPWPAHDDIVDVETRSEEVRLAFGERVTSYLLYNGSASSSV